MALALEVSGRADPETLSVHYRGAGDNDLAAEYAVAAAEQAVTAFAFDRAARLYKLALELRPQELIQGQRLRVKLGDALSNAGRGVEAAHAYLAAVEHANETESIELQRRAA